MALTQISTQGIKDGTITGTDIASNLDLADNQRLRIGTGNDLQLWHDSGYNFIDAVSGVAGFYIRGRNNTIFQQPQLKIRNDANTEDIAKFIENGAVELYYDNSKKFETFSGGISVTGQVNSDGSHMGDSDKALFGDSNDLQIYHDGSNSLIVDAGTGGLILGVAGTGTSGFYKGTGQEPLATFEPDGPVSLYHNNVKKLETTSTGAEVFSTTDASFRVFNTGDGTAKIALHNTGSADFRIENTNAVLTIGTDETSIKATDNGSVELYHDNSKKFETTYSGVTVHNSNFSTLEIRANTQDAVLRLTSHNNDNTDWAIQNDQSESNILDFRFNNTSKMHLTSSGDLHLVGNLDLEDNDKLLLGAGDDLQIYHDGSNSRIVEGGTGSLVLQTSKLNVLNAAGTESMLTATENGAVELYFDNSQKLVTKSYGIFIDGHLQMDDNAIIKLGNSNDLQLYHDGSNSYVADNGAGELRLASFNGSGVRITKSDSETLANFTNDGAIELYHDNSKKFETVAGGVKTNDNNYMGFGNGNDLQIYHDGSHSYLDNSTGQLNIRSSGGIYLRNTGGSESFAKFINNGAVELYYDNSKKFETTSTGIYVSGNDNTFSAGANAVNTTFISSWGGAGATSAIRVKMNSSTNDGLQFQQGGSNTSIAGGNHASTIFNREDARLRLGTDNTEQFRIEANGDLKANDTSIGALSDSRLKKNIADFTYDLSKFKQFKPRTFDWINPKLHGSKSGVRGFIAQEIEIIDTSLVGNYELYDESLTDKNPDLEIIKADDGSNIAKDSKLGTNDAMYISVIQQMLTKIEVLETKVAALKAA